MPHARIRVTETALGLPASVNYPLRKVTKSDTLLLTKLPPELRCMVYDGCFPIGRTIHVLSTKGRSDQRELCLRFCNSEGTDRDHHSFYHKKELNAQTKTWTPPTNFLHPESCFWSVVWFDAPRPDMHALTYFSEPVYWDFIRLWLDRSRFVFSSPMEFFTFLSLLGPQKACFVRKLTIVVDVRQPRRNYPRRKPRSNHPRPNHPPSPGALDLWRTTLESDLLPTLTGLEELHLTIHKWTTYRGEDLGIGMPELNHFTALFGVQSIRLVTCMVIVTSTDVLNQQTLFPEEAKTVAKFFERCCLSKNGIDLWNQAASAWQKYCETSSRFPI